MAKKFGIGFKKDKNSAECKKVHACYAQFDSYMNRSLSDVKDLSLKDYHALTTCKSEASRFQCGYEDSLDDHDVLIGNDGVARLNGRRCDSANASSQSSEDRELYRRCEQFRSEIYEDD